MTAGLDPLPFPAERSSLAPASVSAELSAIFPEIGVGPGPAPAAESKVRAVTGRRRGSIAYASLGAVAAAGILGLTAGSTLLRAHPAKVTAPVVAAAPVAAQPVLPVEVAAEPTVSLHTANLGPIGVAETEPVARPAPAVRRAVATTHRHVTHGDLLAADRRLRAAYSRAIGAGVPRRVLATYRNRWEDLREDASWKPDRVAAGYGAMTADLNRLARRSHGHRPQHGRSLFRLFS
jgi:hypothetical protein